MRSLIILLLVCCFSAGAEPDLGKNDAEFIGKLKEMNDRIEKSSKILRQQIVQNQSAPFLADLYLQLGDLLSEKSTTLYYLQMESDKNTDTKAIATKKFSPIVKAQQEAIGVYEQILKEFPKFDKTDKVLYRLATAQKSIDEGPAFVVTAEKLIKGYPDAKETMQIRLLLGQYYFEMQDYSGATEHLEIVRDSTYPYERNAARYRLGLIYIQKERPADALKMFEAVALDDQLKEDQNPAELDLKTKLTKTNVKREALIDSVRAYTEVYKTNADPVDYYSKIAPTEVLFQETIEKLSFRYIFLKHYGAAIKLLRVLSERISDPQKIMNIYHQVLVTIPVEERLDVPVAEMAYVLNKYNDWSTHYALSSQLRNTTFRFFERQIRELGTRSHDLAKRAAEPRKGQLYERARQYYQLYLGYFGKGRQSVKIATNLADVYFNQRNFFQSGSYYLRVFSGEFGPAAQKEDLIQNAILSLQKPVDYAYYEQLRAKGLMVKAVESYMAMRPQKRQDASLRFALAKAYYEQGYYERAIGDLYKIVAQFPSAKESGDAADLILNYYNTRGDFKNLAFWSNKMLALNSTNSSLKSRLKDVAAKAQLRQLDEQVKTQKNYDVTSQGKSYLQTALSISDVSLRSAALQQALGHSKQERDIETFLKTATTMSKAERDPAKRVEIWNSMAEELLGITRFRLAYRTYSHMSGDSSLAEKARASAFDKSVKIAAMLRDPELLAGLLDSPQVMSLPGETRESAEQQLTSALENPIALSPRMQKYLVTRARGEELLALFKGQLKLSGSARQALLSRVHRECEKGAVSALCKWATWPAAAAQIKSFEATMAKAPAVMGSVEPAANRMASLLTAVKGYESSGIARLDMLISLGNAQIYQAFAQFLERTAAANKDLAPVLNAKAAESFSASKQNHDQCGRILRSADLKSARLTELCGQGRGLASVEATLESNVRYKIDAPKNDPSGSGILDQQKALFVSRDNWKSYMDIGETYLRDRQWHHAAATAALGRTAFPSSEEEFNAILGCALVNIGFLNEAQFLLNKASDMNGHKTACLEQLRRIDR